MVKFSEFDDFSPVEDGSTRYDMGSSTLWEVGRKGSGFTVELNAGRTFDITVPRVLRWFLSPHNRRVLMAAKLHDQLLEDGFDQAFASSEFRRALRARGARGSYAWLLFFATLFVTAFKGNLDNVPQG